MNSQGINLLSDKRSVKPYDPIKRRLRLIRVSAIFVLFAVGAASIILSILIVFSPLEKLREDEQQARNTLQHYNLEINKLAFINDRGDAIRQIIDKREAIDKKLDILITKMPADVSFDGVTMLGKSYTVKFSSDNLASLNEFVDAVVDSTGPKKDFVKVFLTSLSTDTESDRFVLVIDLLTV